VHVEQHRLRAGDFLRPLGVEHGLALVREFLGGEAALLEGAFQEIRLTEWIHEYQKRQRADSVD
jgi:hypothetical protein